MSGKYPTYTPEEVRAMSVEQKKKAMVSKYFSVWEVECHCGCGFAQSQQKHLDAMDEWREKIGKPILTRWEGGGSFCRCVAHNKKVGGETGSFHCAGLATDCRVVGLSPQELAASALAVERFRQGGIGIYPRGKGRGWVHVDSGTGNKRPGRWTK
jgi:hypothetical protein